MPKTSGSSMKWKSCENGSVVKGNVLLTGVTGPCTMRVSATFLATLALSYAGGVFLSISRGQDKFELPNELELSYQDFDQRPGSGWRKVARDGKFLEAAELIERYEKSKTGLNEWQQINLRFHAGQLYAFADKYDQALSRFETALVPREPPDAPIRWNAYVKATIAFLKKDRESLRSFRDEIAKGPKLQGSVPNLDVVDRLIEHFDEPYRVAYSGKPKCN